MKTATEQQLEDQIVHLESQLRLARKRRTWLCPRCERRTQIGKLKLEVEHYYVAPHGCTGGDYYTEGDKPTFYIGCPKCNEETREYEYYDAAGRYKFVTAYRYHFGDSGIRDS